MHTDHYVTQHGLLSRGYPGAPCHPGLHQERQPVAQRLTATAFKSAVDSLALVSIDLIVQCDGRYLVGRRNNQPASGSWFVPGGRILKNEPIPDALHRTILEELGLQRPRGAVALRGIFEHFYSVDFTGDVGASTHYIVLAHDVVLSRIPESLPCAQHTQYQWLSRSDILAHQDVHRYTKSYFVENP